MTFDNSFGDDWRLVYQAPYAPKENKIVPVTPEIENEILISHQKTRSPFKTATIVGVEVEDVFKVLDKNKASVGMGAERYGGKGRPELEPFIVARRRANETGWDNSNPLIEQAREDYAAGTHEMATGRDGGWLILYSFPRRRVDKTRADYFSTECQ